MKIFTASISNVFTYILILATVTCRDEEEYADVSIAIDDDSEY